MTLGILDLFRRFKPPTRPDGTRIHNAFWRHPVGTDPDVYSPPTVERFRVMYHEPPSFTALLPWIDYDGKTRAFLLDDGRSAGSLLEITPAATEARPAAWLEEFRDKVQVALSALPETDPPWILQIYVQDEPRLDLLTDEIAAYARAEVRESPYSQDWFRVLREHLRDISRTDGLFVDDLVTGGHWSGRRRRVRVALSRRRRPGEVAYGELSAIQELNDATDRLTTALESAGLRVRRCDGRDLWAWLFRWFNPNPFQAEDTEEVMRLMGGYPGDDQPFERWYRGTGVWGYDLSRQMSLGPPVVEPDLGLWWHDGVAHRAITVDALKQEPAIGLLTMERPIGEHTYAVWDRMPEHAVLSLTIVVQPQDEVRQHLLRIERASFGDHAEARLAAEDARQAQIEIAKGNRLYPVQTVLYVRSDSRRPDESLPRPDDARLKQGEAEASLRRRVHRVVSLLQSQAIVPIPEQYDLIACDTYLRALPHAFDWHLDRKASKRARLMFGRQIANLAPVYGRSTGTGNPGLLFYNRGGEPLMFDPLNLHDRKKNAHGLILGPTGAGKSALLVYFVLHMLAVHRPRVFIIETGNSFGLLGQYLAARGLTVNQVTMNPASDVSLPPFGDALRLFDKSQQGRLRALLDLDLAQLADDSDDADPLDDDTDENRDILGEMEIAARIMITGGEAKEDARMTRADRMLIRKAILSAAELVLRAQQSGADGHQQVLTEDVVKELAKLAKSKTLPAQRKQRAQEMADAMELFCSGLAGQFFNRPGQTWPEADVTIVDLAILAREGYEDQLTVAYIGLMNNTNALVERVQHERRPTLMITDEGHLITTNALLSPYVLKIIKTWRKLGAWYWIATQNLEDFPDAARRMLSLLEWWLCMVMPKDEITQIARFRDLTEEQTALLLAAKKNPGKYTEGVVLTDHIAALFRNVPPALALALAMTEKDEKAERSALMAEHGCTELEAALLVAERIQARRRA